jgi:outer membrane protein assembly factor BamB
LGNLYPWNTDIISVGLDHVAAYPCDVTVQRIFDFAETSGETPDQVRWKRHERLAIAAQLELQQRNYQEAARLISEAYDLFPNSSYAGVLVEVLTEMIAVDFKQAEAIFSRYKGLFKERDLRQLLRGKVDGLVRSQRYEEAFSTLLEIANGVEFPDRDAIKPGADIAGRELVQLFVNDIDLTPEISNTKQNGVVEISRTSWLRWQLSQLSGRVIAKSKMNLENKMTKEDLMVLIAKHLESFKEQKTETFFQHLQLFPQNLIAPALIVDTARRLLSSQQHIKAKSLLMGDWTDDGVVPEVVAERLALLGQIAIDQQDVSTTMSLINRLKESNTDANPKELVRMREQAESLSKALRENVYDDQLYLKLARDRSVLRGPRFNLGGVQWKREVAQIGDAEQVPFGDGRHKCDILETDVQEIHKLVFRYEVSRAELQIHDSFGRRVRSVYLRTNGDLDSFQSRNTGKIFLKNSVMLFCIGREIFALDWIRMVRGIDPIMWSIRLEKGTSTKNVFGGPRSSGVCFVDGSELKCVDLFTGQLRWVRNRIPRSSMIKEGNDRITIWADHLRIYETFDKLSGRRIAGGKISKLNGWTSKGHNQFHLFQSSIRGKAEDDSSNPPASTPDDPFSELPVTDLKLQLFDFDLGEVSWERTFPFPTISRQVDQTSIAVLTMDGILSLLDLATGKVRFEQQIEGLTDISDSTLSVVPMAQGYICAVGTTQRENSIIAVDKTTELKFSEFKKHGWLGKGYIFAVDRETGKALWDNPVRVESFGLLDGTPYDSPFLMLARRANYRPSKKGVKQATLGKTRIQVAMLDVATGQLKSNHLFNVARIGSVPRFQLVCRPGEENRSNKVRNSGSEESSNDDNQNQRLELSIASQRFNIQLTEAEADAQVRAPAVLSNDASVMKLEDELGKIAVEKGGNLVVDLEPVAQRAKEAYDAMLELGKVESELFEEQAKARQQQP